MVTARGALRLTSSPPGAGEIDVSLTLDPDTSGAPALDEQLELAVEAPAHRVLGEFLDEALPSGQPDRLPQLG